MSKKAKKCSGCTRLRKILHRTHEAFTRRLRELEAIHARVLASRSVMRKTLRETQDTHVRLREECLTLHQKLLRLGVNSETGETLQQANQRLAALADRNYRDYLKFRHKAEALEGLIKRRMR